MIKFFLFILVLIFILVIYGFKSSTENFNNSHEGLTGTIVRSSLPQSFIDSMDKLSTKGPPLPKVSLPKNYDLRKIVLGSEIQPPLDQKTCGSCWAFAIATTMTDRWRMRTKGDPFSTNIDFDYSSGGKKTVPNQLSPFLIASCDFCDKNSIIKDILINNKQCNSECNGGVIQYGYNFIHDNGMISMVCNKDAQSYACHPYKHISKMINSSYFCWVWQFGPTNQVHLYECDLLNDESRLEKNMENIQKNIYSYGPVTASFKVYQSFYNYFKNTPEGIYTSISSNDTLVGGHAISIIGWGENDSGVKYWICKNSWGLNWGDKGYFKILRGRNFCQIECDVWEAEPDIPNTIKKTIEIYGTDFSKLPTAERKKAIKERDVILGSES
jgi:Papain family cysteine protease